MIVKVNAEIKTTTIRNFAGMNAGPSKLYHQPLKTTTISF